MGCEEGEGMKNLARNLLGFLAVIFIFVQIRVDVNAQNLEPLVNLPHKVFIPMVAVSKIGENQVVPTSTLAPTLTPTLTSTPTPTPTPIIVENCPSSPSEMASIVGGMQNMWTPPSWVGGAWTFSSGGSFHTLTVPSFVTLSSWIDFWNGSTSSPDRLEEGESLSLSDASFHCQP